MKYSKKNTENDIAYIHTAAIHFSQMLMLSASGLSFLHECNVANRGKAWPLFLLYPFLEVTSISEVSIIISKHVFIPKLHVYDFMNNILLFCGCNWLWFSSLWWLVILSMFSCVLIGHLYVFSGAMSICPFLIELFICFECFIL